MTSQFKPEKAPRTVSLPTELYQQLLQTYFKDTQGIESLSVIEGEHARINVRVTLNQHPPVILRIYVQDPQNTQKEKFLSDLLHKKLPCPQFHYVGQDQGYTFAIIECIPGITLRDYLLTHDNPDISSIMYQVGTIGYHLSQIHLPANSPNLNPQTPATTNGVTALIHQYLMSMPVINLLTEVQIERIREIFQAYKNLLPENTQTQLVHGNFNPDNILVQESHNGIQVTGILGWEYAFSGSYLWNVAIMLRHAHQMPPEFRQSFLEGLGASGMQLPQSWPITVNLLNLISLLDECQRTEFTNKPQQAQDIKDQIDHILSHLYNIELSPYDPHWPVIYAQQAEKISQALGKGLCQIYHVGSTAVPGMTAKSKIDIIAECHDLLFDHQPLEQIAYTYRGGFGLPLRKSFTYRSSTLSVNLHIFEKDDPEITLNLLFRDYLREHPSARQAYMTLKNDLIQCDSSHKKEGSSYRGYTLGKNDFIQDILRKAGFNRHRIALCFHPIEKQTAIIWRQRLYTDNDPYLNTFDQADHKHFILYQGTDMIGYAHLQLHNCSQASLQCVIIEPPDHNKVHERALLHFINKWLRLSQLEYAEETTSS